MADGLLVTPAFVRAVREHERRLNNEPLNRPQPRGKYPIAIGTAPTKYYQLADNNTMIYRGSHRTGCPAVEVVPDSTDAGRIIWRQVRTDVKLMVGTLKGVYIQRDGSTHTGDDAGTGDGGDESDGSDPNGCPDGWLTVNGQCVPPPGSWKSLRSAAPTASAKPASSTLPSVFACEGQRRNGFDFINGEGEHVWIATVSGDLTGAGGTVLLDGTYEVTAANLCTSAISDGSLVQVQFREMAGIGGFAITKELCCAGYQR